MNGKLPTLLFNLYMGEEGIIHDYYEKDMKNQVLLMERSAIGRQQLMSIMSNELRRRLIVIRDEIPQNERNLVVAKYTQQLVNSGYSWKQCRDNIVSGLKGEIRREEKVKKMGTSRYRSGKESLNDRDNKPLLEKYHWFRRKKSYIMRKMKKRKRNMGNGTITEKEKRKLRLSLMKKKRK